MHTHGVNHCLYHFAAEIHMTKCVKENPSRHMTDLAKVLWGGCYNAKRRKDTVMRPEEVEMTKGGNGPRIQLDRLSDRFFKYL